MKFSITNHQRAKPFDLGRLEILTSNALELCLAECPPRRKCPPAFPQSVEISLISDAAIARVHAEFFSDPTPTDVITFPHGEILLGAATLHRQAAEYGHPPDREALLCIIHGFLHLRGFDDLRPAQRQVMHRKQEAILQKIWPFIPSATA